MKITKSVLTRLNTGTGVTIGGLNVPRYALTRLRGVEISGESTYRVRREFARADDSVGGVAIP